MAKFPRSIWCKTAAVILVGLLAFQSEFLLSQGTDTMAERFAAARTSYAAGDFEGARAALEAMMAEVEEMGDDSLRGEAYLLLGAVFEKLQKKEEAVDYFCRAKELLGEGEGGEGLDLSELQYYQEPCPPSLEPAAASVAVVDVFQGRFDEARTAFFSGNAEGARIILEPLIADIAGVDGRDVLKGEIYLLAGAAYEKLKYKELAVKYFCLAKGILGQGKSIEGLVLKDYKYYKADCRPVPAAARVVKRKGGFGRFLGTLLGLAAVAVGGYLLYTKVIKKKDEDSNKDIYYENEYQAWTCWYASATSSSSTKPSITPADNWAPNPSFGNSYDSTSTVSITGPKITSWSVKLAVTACKGLTRRDIVYVNDVQKIDVTNTFDRACGGAIADFCSDPADGKEYAIASGSGEVTLKLRHHIIFTQPGGATVSVVNNATFTGN